MLIEIMFNEERLVFKTGVFLRLLALAGLLIVVGEITYAVIFKPENLTRSKPTDWILIIAWVAFLLIPLLTIFPFSYYYINRNGIGDYLAIGFTNKAKIIIRDHFEYWDQIQLVDYLDVSPWFEKLLIRSHVDKQLSIDVKNITNKKAAIKILLEKLPRDKASEVAERCFFRKWERKFEEEEHKKEKKRLEHESKNI